MLFHSSLHGRFQRAVIGAAAAISAVVAVAVYLSARSHYIESGETSVRTITAAVQKTMAVGVYANDRVLLNELVEGLAHHPAMGRVEVRDMAGNAMASDPPRARPDAPGAGDASGAAFQAFPLASPFDPLETVGYLDIWLDHQHLRADAGRQAAVLVVAFLVLLMGALTVFNTLARRMLSRPMHRLAEDLARIRPGTAHRMAIHPAHAVNEVGMVTAAVNRLLALQEAALERERAMRRERAALEARYRGIFESTGAGIFILSGDGRLLHANPALGRLLGDAPDRPARADGADFARDFFLRPAELGELIDRARESCQPEAADLELAGTDEPRQWVHCMVSFKVDADTRAQRVEGVLYDITRRKALEREAQHRAEHDALTGLKSRAHIEALLGRHVAEDDGRSGTVTLMFIDLDGFKSVNDRWGHGAGDAVLVEASRRLRALFQRGCDAIGRLGGDELGVVIGGVEATDAPVAALAAALVERLGEPFDLPGGEIARIGASVGVASHPLHAGSVRALFRAADAAMYAVKQSGKGGFLVARAGADDGWQETIGSLTVASPAQRDALTGLMDRRHLIEHLTVEFAPGTGGERPAAVICIDIDRFKLINVAHGARTGDEVLCETSRRLMGLLRRGDRLARTGGDEFIVVAPVGAGSREEPRRMAETIASKLLESLSRPFNLSQGSFDIRASAGASLIGPGTVDGLDALRQAQLALRRSKTPGGGGLVFFEEDMLTGFHERLALEEDLRAAIGSDQLFLHVQPQRDAQGRIRGGEALLRWRHPTRGMVPPDRFIDIAEASGLIAGLGCWILGAGCRILSRMHAHGSALPLAINISPAQFDHPDFVEEVKRALRDSGAPADHLVLEITEGILITDAALAAERLREIAELGVRFSIDDFGTGFSSLSYLRQLPLHEIKIDKSFIVGLPDDTASVGIVCSILSMGSHLGLHVVAEGVETPEQSAFLSVHRCPTQQGWLHGRPMAEDDFIRLVQQPAGRDAHM